MPGSTTGSSGPAPAQAAPPAGDKGDKGLGISAPQVAGGALAAVTAAVAASFFGVTGTLMGAAFGSVVSSVGAAVYAASLRRAADRGIAVTRTLVVRSSPDARPDGTPETSQDPTALPPDLAVDATTVPPAQDAAPRGSGIAAKIRWKPVALLAAAAFVLGLGVITVAEAVIGRPVSGGTGGTSVSRFVEGDVPGSDTDTSTPDPSPSDPTATPSPSVSDASPAATPEPSSSSGDGMDEGDQEPTGTGTPGPTSPSPTVSPSPQVTPSGGQSTRGSSSLVPTSPGSGQRGQ